MFEIFECLLQASQADFIEVQSNDALITAMLHTFAHDVRSESILFEDWITTDLSPPGATFRRARPGDVAGVSSDQLTWHGVVEIEGVVVGSGGILFHYNRPYGDIYMEVKDSFRRRGVGSFIVQELKQICYEGGNIPAARCNPSNEASRRTLQKSGFIPCGHILKGSVRGHKVGFLP